MKIIKFTTLPEGEKSKLNLNNLKPVEKVVGEVVFEVEKNVDDGNNKQANLEFINNLKKKGGISFLHFHNIRQEDIDLIEYIIGRKLLKSDFEDVEYIGKRKKDIIYNFLYDFSLSESNEKGNNKRKVLNTFKEYLKDNFDLLENDDLVYHIFCFTDPHYIKNVINGVERILDKKISDFDIDFELLNGIRILFNQFDDNYRIGLIKKLFDGEITIDDFKLKEGEYKNVLSRLLLTFPNFIGKIKSIKGIFGDKLCFDDLRNLDDGYWNYIEKMDEKENISEEIVKFGLDKGIFENLEEFLILYNKGLFTNVNEELFIKNFEYLLENFGRVLNFDDFYDDYLPKFIKYADSDNFDFLLKEIQKSGGTASKFESLIKMFYSKKDEKDIEYLQIFSFISQSGLSKKIEYFYEKTGKEVDIFDYFNSYGKYHKYQDIGNIAENKNKAFENFNEKNKNKEEHITKFNNSLDFLLEKYSELELSSDLFYLLDTNFEEKKGLFNKFPDIKLEKKYFEFLKIDNILEKINILEKYGFSYTLEELTEKDFTEFLKQKDLEVFDFLLNYYKNEIKNKKDLFFLDIFKKENISNIKLIFSKDISFNLIKNNNFIKFVGYYFGDFIKIVGLYDTKEEIEKIFNNELEFLDIEKIVEKYNSNFFNYKKSIKLIFRKLKKNFKNIGNKKLKNVGYENFLFNVSAKGGRIFDDLIDDMKNNPEDNLYNVMQKEIDKKYEELVPKNSKKYNDEEIIKNQKRILNHQEKYFSKEDNNIGKELGINEDNLDFSIYLRYGHTVDFPEIAEYIILFLEKYFAEGNSKYFKNIRIVPREIDNFPNEKFFKNRNIKKYNVKGQKNYEIAMYYKSVGQHLSHSENSNNNPYKTSQNVSCSMYNRENFDIKSKIELEHSCRDENCLKNLEVNLSEILKEILQNIKDLEKELDKIK